MRDIIIRLLPLRFVLSLWPSGATVEVRAAGPTSIPTATQDEDKFYTGHDIILISKSRLPTKQIVLTITIRGVTGT